MNLTEVYLDTRTGMFEVIIEGGLAEERFRLDQDQLVDLIACAQRALEFGYAEYVDGKLV